MYNARPKGISNFSGTLGSSRPAAECHARSERRPPNASFPTPHPGPVGCCLVKVTLLALLALCCFRAPFFRTGAQLQLSLLLGPRTSFPLSPPCSLSWHRNSKINERVVNREKILCPCGVDVDCSSTAQAAMTTAQAAYFFTQTHRGPSSADASVQCALQLLEGVPAGLTKCR